MSSTYFKSTNHSWSYQCHSNTQRLVCTMKQLLNSISFWYNLTTFKVIKQKYIGRWSYLQIIWYEILINKFSDRFTHNLKLQCCDYSRFFAYLIHIYCLLVIDLNVDVSNKRDLYAWKMNIIENMEIHFLLNKKQFSLDGNCMLANKRWFEKCFWNKSWIECVWSYYYIWLF